MNRLFLLLFGMVTFVAHTQVPDYVPTEGLVAWYPLDGHVLDSGPNALDGVLNGTSTVTNRFDEVESALSLDGADDWVDFGYNDAWHLEDFTLNIWYSTLEWPQLSDYDAIVAAGDAYFMFVGDAGAGGGGNSSFYVSTSPLQGGVWSYENNSDGQWHMMTGIRNASAESIELYIDGVNVGSAAASGGLLVGEQPLSIGRFWDFNPHWFDGSVDDFGIWNRALTEEEILALYNAEPPVTGCTDSTACNFDAEATSDDGSCIPSGCMDSEACNYNALAECEGEGCDYSCCPGPGCCGDGMYWDYEASQCAIIETCQDDLDGDGVIGVNDLMQLLSSFGTDCAPTEEPETAEWTCGDPVSYHGYDYATVQIGEQCWFAENLRSELYRTGAPIPTLSSPEVWNATTIGARTRFGEWGTECDHDVEAFNACNPELALIEFGYLYNWLAVDDVRALCPTDWHVPTESEWNELFDAVGGPGTASDALKSPEGWAFDGSGTQDIGFNAKPGAQRQITPLPWASAGAYGFWWSSSAPTASDAWGFKLSCFQDNVLLSVESQNIGRSIRCLKVQ